MLSYGTAVQVRVVAFNSVGDGPSSQVGGEAVSATVPDFPRFLTRVNSLTTTKVLSLTWEDGDFNGGSPIIDYEVSYD